MQDSNDMMGPILSEQGQSKVKFAGGATASAGVPDYTDGPQAGIDYLARRSNLGTARHGRGNWFKSIHSPEFIRERYNHLVKHTRQLITKQGDDTPQGNIEAIIWNGSFLAEAFERYPEAFTEALATPFDKQVAGGCGQAKVNDYALEKLASSKSSTGADLRNCGCDRTPPVACKFHAARRL